MPNPITQINVTAKVNSMKAGKPKADVYEPIHYGALIYDPAIVHHKCSYCGGYDEVKHEGVQDAWESALEIKSLDDKISICDKCLIKALDKLLGPRK